ncbi:MAG: hypothetical protein K2H43_06180, partial [Clostridia bacterium]|nr:hypothetical protein [Clostridia bacterium]
MISYDTYKNRIRRIAAVKNFIVRFRVLFLILLALIVGLISTFLALKGMIVGGLVLPEGVVYGESFEIEPAKALFSGTRLEYAYLGMSETDGRARSLAATSAAKTDSYEWTREKPVLAGRYLVRTVT